MDCSLPSGQKRPDELARTFRLSGTAGRLDYLERVRRERVVKTLCGHKCSEACGVTPHPACPLWPLARGYLDLPRHDPRYLTAAKCVPGLVEDFKRDVKTAHRLAPHLDDLLRVADLLPDEVVEVFIRAIRSASAPRLQALALLLFEALRPQLIELLVAEVPDMIAARVM